MTALRTYFFIQTEPGTVEWVSGYARTFIPVVWVDAITGSYDVVVHATGSRDELAAVSAALRDIEGVQRVLVCTPAEINLEVAREPARQ
jgi:hypothetical protein